MSEELPTKWNLPFEWSEWALLVRQDWAPEHVRACAKLFHKYYTSRRTLKAGDMAWEQAWHSWVRNQRTEGLRVHLEGWWTSASGITAKGAETGVTQHEGEAFPYFKARVFVAAGDGPWSFQKPQHRAW